MATGEIELIYCRNCSRKTNHSVLCKGREKADPDDGIWRRTYHLAQCAGCETYCYATATESEDTYDHRLERMVPEWDVYPTPEGEQKPLDKYFLFPTKVRAIYLEVVKAINGDLVLLAAIGLRALIETICKERGVSARNLEMLIDGLAEGGVLSRRESEILHRLRFMGNAVAHEISRPHRDEVLAALVIAESMLRTIYITPRLSQKVRTGSRKTEAGKTLQSRARVRTRVGRQLNLTNRDSK